MFDIIHYPTFKLAVRYKCRSCGHESRLLTALIRKKCPHCGESKLKPVLGITESKPIFPFVN
jgi:Zn finger protein HypA/HybF involved in hydrogenase expression